MCYIYKLYIFGFVSYFFPLIWIYIYICGNFFFLLIYVNVGKKFLLE